MTIATPAKLMTGDPESGRLLTLSNLKSVWGEASVSKGLLFAAGALTLVEIAGSLAFPMLTRAVVDGIGGEGFRGIDKSVDAGLVLLCAVLIAAAFSGATSRYLLSKVGLRAVASLKNRLIKKLVSAPVAYLEDSASGAHTSRIMQDSRILSQLVSRDAINAFSGTLLLCGTAVILFTLDFALAAILFAVIGAAFLVALPVILTLAGTAFRLQEVTAALSGQLTQMFSEIRLVKASGGEPAEIGRARKRVGDLMILGLRTARVESALQPIISLAVTCSMITILAYGGVRVAEGTLSAGTLTAFLLYIFAVVGPLAQLSSFFSQLTTARGALFRIGEVLQCPDENGIAEEKEGTSRSNFPERGALVFENVAFQYPGKSSNSLKIEHLKFHEGSKTAIIGPSGSGKSTLLSLIERFYEPTSGRITYAGQDISDLNLTGWRGRIGYVSQSAALLSGSIADNLLYGLEHNVTENELRQALVLSRCDEFVAKLEMGLKTQVGEQGLRLSGGQRQRIALGRMFLRNPDILLLDEATSQLDEENEHLVLQGLKNLMQGRTTIFVTHRLALVEDMDRIIMLDDGHITAAGDHSGLLENNQFYRRVATRSYLPERAA